ncbi:concanavalin A-like lectin/glucanase domain-containing protein [Glomus cerebriforme]|uniref:Concanavalin A-like lectin/glucanase domain-containing protein n=1 Tax=Glomus cerebriforme TaxID=658196 RepID=A0A397SVC7_9GLOM|nr:concanavalin A-like lectin/glucanase domain-containing protein [Glomus cerebriforme]
MPRGNSLEQDLRLLLNNPKYSDIEIICKDKKKLYGSRAILAARSEVFDGLLYNGMKESYERQISFPTIASVGMEIIFEYTYTGSVKEESLTKDNIIEAFYAADYFQFLDLQKFLMNILKNTLGNNCSPELLSKAAEIMPLSENNIIINLLIETVSTIPLSTIELGRLSIAGLRCLLYYTHEKEKPFVTPEYDVFRYSAILAAKQVSNVACRTLIEKLPPNLERIEQRVQVRNNLITDHKKVAKELEPLVKYIDFRLIKGQVLVDIIEPLGIIPTEIILDIYRHNTKSINSESNNIRGISYVLDDSACGSKLILENNGKVVYAPDGCNLHQSVRAKIALENKGLFEWDVIIEKFCKNVWVGVCASENFNYEGWAGDQATGWVLGSSGNYCNSGNWLNNYCPKFGDGSKVTVHLDMNKRTCAFTVNGTRYQEVPCWNNLPPKLYPVVSLRYPGRFRIQPHQKN